MHHHHQLINPHTKNTITFILKFSGGLNGPVKRSQDKLRGLCIRLSGRHSTKTTETLALEIPDPRMPWDPLRVPTHSGNHVEICYCFFLYSGSKDQSFDHSFRSRCRATYKKWVRPSSPSAASHFCILRRSCIPPDEKFSDRATYK